MSGLFGGGGATTGVSPTPGGFDLGSLLSAPSGGFGSQGGFDFNKVNANPLFNLGIGLLSSSGPQANANFGSRLGQAFQFQQARADSALQNQISQARLGELQSQQRAKAQQQEALQGLFGLLGGGGGGTGVGTPTTTGVPGGATIPGGATGQPVLPTQQGVGTGGLLGGQGSVPGIPTGPGGAGAPITGINPAAQGELDRQLGQNSNPFAKVFNPQQRQALQLLAQADPGAATEILTNRLFPAPLESSQQAAFLRQNGVEPTASDLRDLAGISVPQLTAFQQNAIAAGIQPGTPEFRNLLTKSQDRSTSIKINQIADTEAVKQLAQNNSTFVNQVQEGGSAARSRLALLATAKQLSPEAVAGAGAETQLGVRKLLDSVGFEGDKSKISASEGLDLVLNQLTNEALASQKGPATDADAIRASIARLGDSAEGRELRLTIAQRQAQIAARKEEIVQQALTDESVGEADRLSRARRAVAQFEKEQSGVGLLTPEDKTRFGITGGGGSSNRLKFNPETGLLE